MGRKAQKYLNNVHQHELNKLMAFTVLWQIAADIYNCIYYTIMADELTDADNNKKQFMICFRWVDENLECHKDFIGLYKIDNIKSDTLVACLEHVLLRINTLIENARGQWFDGAANMTGFRNEVSMQILKKAP